MEVWYGQGDIRVPPELVHDRERVDLAGGGREVDSADDILDRRLSIEKSRTVGAGSGWKRRCGGPFWERGDFREETNVAEGSVGIWIGRVYPDQAAEVDPENQGIGLL